jgi:hypothetical protein
MKAYGIEILQQFWGELSGVTFESAWAIYAEQNRPTVFSDLNTTHCFQLIDPHPKR